LAGGVREEDQDCFTVSDLDLLSQKFASLSVGLYESWDSLRSNMEPLTEDGGVIKQIISSGTF